MKTIKTESPTLTLKEYAALFVGGLALIFICLAAWNVGITLLQQDGIKDLLTP